MQRITKDHLACYYSPYDKPVAMVEPFEVFQIETHDRFGEDENLENMLGADDDAINAVTGPVAIKGAKVGQVLKVKIHKIEALSNVGFILSVPGKGVFNHKEKEKKVVPLKDGYGLFSENIRIPLHPHIGRIATAPAKGEYPTATPGPFGGNMDISQLGEGSSVYLPVFVPGAHLFVGDIHGAMGDGESNLSGIEIDASITLVCTLIDDLQITYPLVETEKEVMTTADGLTLDEASRIALMAMLEILMKRANLSYSDAAMLISSAANLRVSQIVNPRVGVRVTLAKEIIGEIFP